MQKNPKNAPEAQVPENAVNPSVTNDNAAKRRPDMGRPDLYARVPAHIANISILLINNAEIRRFTAIGIRNYLLQKGEVRPGSVYVKFLPSKFAVRNNGLGREYDYSEPFFLNALAAAFPSFAASANKAIDILCRTVMSCSADKAIDKEEVQAMIDSNLQHIDGTAEKSEVTVE